MSVPTLVILAAGIGSRYGGLKQIDPIDEHGNIIINYSIYDALVAGFRRIVCVIKEEIEQDFRRIVGDRIEKSAQVQYVYQTIHALPEGFSVPPGREKPWGTGHALLCAKGVLDGPFAVVNADDYYGRDAYKTIFDHLYTPHSDKVHAMIGYEVQNTLTEHGAVTRGICDVDDEGFLEHISEITGIRPCADGGVYEAGGKEISIKKGTTVSMNLWGFNPNFLDVLERDFPDFLRGAQADNTLRAEYLLPELVQRAMESDDMRVKVLPSRDTWFGVTYKEDMGPAREMIRGLRDRGMYSQMLEVSLLSPF